MEVKKDDTEKLPDENQEVEEEEYETMESAALNLSYLASAFSSLTEIDPMLLEKAEIRKLRKAKDNILNGIYYYAEFFE